MGSARKTPDKNQGRKFGQFFQVRYQFFIFSLSPKASRNQWCFLKSGA